MALTCDNIYVSKCDAPISAQHLFGLLIVAEDECLKLRANLTVVSEEDFCSDLQCPADMGLETIFKNLVIENGDGCAELNLVYKT